MTVRSGILFVRFSTIDYMVGTNSTVEKRAKRMPDPTVETTLTHTITKTAQKES